MGGILSPGCRRREDKNNPNSASQQRVDQAGHAAGFIDGIDPKPTFLIESNVVGRQTSTAHPRRFAGVGEGAQFASLALTALAGAATPGLRVRATLDLTNRLTVDFAMASPHTLSRRCVGPLLKGA